MGAKPKTFNAPARPDFSKSASDSKNGLLDKVNSLRIEFGPSLRDVQAFTNQVEDQQADYVVGMKMGLRLSDHRFEWGIDGRLGEGEPEAVVFQVKYAVQPWEKLPTFALGAANIAVTSEDRNEVGQAFKFGVLTQDFGAFRGHVGYGFQQNNDAAFFGLDTTIPVLGRDLMLRTDLIQIQNRDQWLGSVGFIYSLHEHVAVESWVAQPFESGKTAFTLKLNLIFEF